MTTNRALVRRGNSSNVIGLRAIWICALDVEAIIDSRLLLALTAFMLHGYTIDWIDLCAVRALHIPISDQTGHSFAICGIT